MLLESANAFNIIQKFMHKTCMMIHNSKYKKYVKNPGSFPGFQVCVVTLQIGSLIEKALFFEVGFV